MATFGVLIFAADNLTNPQNPGFFPAEDNSHRSDLQNGDQLTWNGGGESAFIEIDDPSGTSFDELETDQTLVTSLTFDGSTYSSGQVLTPSYTIIFSGSDGNNYTLTSLIFAAGGQPRIPDAIFWEGSIPPAGTVLTATSERDPKGNQARNYLDFVACFCEGTLIETKDGPKAVEQLTCKDKVATLHGHFMSIKAVCNRSIACSELLDNPNLRPVVVSQGALGRGLPKRNLRVSKQHRFLVSSPICRRMFGTDATLVSAIQLTQLPGIFIDTKTNDLRYFHILLQNHEIIFAEGAPTESLHLGKGTLKALPQETVKEITSIFPDLLDSGFLPKSVELIPEGRRQKKLIARHLKNNKPLLTKDMTLSLAQ